MKKLLCKIFLLFCITTVIFSFTACQKPAGESAYDIYKNDNPKYKGDEEQWIDDLANGKIAYEAGYQTVYGESAYEIYKKYYPEYKDSEEQWIDDIANGKLVFYTVTFNGNGGMHVSGHILQKVTYYKTAVAPVFQKSGYILSWDKDYKNITCDTAVTAVWTDKEEVFKNLFIKGGTEHDYNKYFDFNTENPDFTYECGTGENEKIFERILNGEEDYRDFFGWFAYNPDYIYRYNEESLKCAGAVLLEGKFSDTLKSKYWGLYNNIGSSHPYLPAMGKNGEYFQIYFNSDWSVNYIWEFVIYDGRQESGFDLWHVSLPGYTLGAWQYGGYNETRQLDRFVYPIYDNNGKINGYYLGFSQLIIEVDSGDGTYANGVVHASYYLETTAEDVWDAEKASGERITMISNCRISYGNNNDYDFYTEHGGVWNLEEVWKAYREVVLNPGGYRTDFTQNRIIKY